jgi:hypothetical protein
MRGFRAAVIILLILLSVVEPALGTKLVPSVATLPP